MNKEREGTMTMKGNKNNEEAKGDERDEQKEESKQEGLLRLLAFSLLLNPPRAVCSIMLVFILIRFVRHSFFSPSKMRKARKTRKEAKKIHKNANNEIFNHQHKTNETFAKPT